jgi:hypothetical protein
LIRHDSVFICQIKKNCKKFPKHNLLNELIQKLCKAGKRFMSHRPAPLVGRKGLTSETRKGRCAAGQGMANSERQEKKEKKKRGRKRKGEKKRRKRKEGGKKNQ